MEGNRHTGILENAVKEFEKYLDEYDREDDKIRLKIIHTYGVMDCADQITRQMDLPDEDKDLAQLIALLHDIGRFEQVRRFDSFEPGSMDHAAYGAGLLFGKKKMIRRFVEDDRFDDIIRIAIEKHSDFKLEGVEEPRTLFHAKLIRDADKLDNCRVKLEEKIETLFDASEEEAGSGLISDKVWESCLKKESVLSADRVTAVDYWVSYIAQYYDINFPETFQIILKENYVPRIADRLKYSQKDTQEKMKLLVEQVEDYMRSYQGDGNGAG